MTHHGFWLGLAVAGALAGAGRAETQTAPAESPAQDIYETGMSYLREGLQAQAPDLVTNLCQRAIEHFQAALELDRKFCPAQHAWALALVAQAHQAENPAEFTLRAQVARERFAHAADCPGVDAALFEDWGQLLVSRVDLLARSTYARFSILTEARQAFEEGLRRARTAEEQTKLTASLANCLSRLALYAPNRKEEAVLLERADTLFQSVVQSGKQPAHEGLYAAWGLALLKLGQITGDTNRLHQAITRMQTGLQISASGRDPNALGLHYNLACTYAGLGDLANALGHLRVCLENDPKGSYAASACADRDLEVLWRTDEFRELIRARAPATTAGPADTPENRAGRFFREGYRLADQAAANTNRSERVRDFELAIAQFRAAAELRPNFAPAHLLWANCLVQTESSTTNETDRLEHIRLTRERFAVATDCPDADARVYEASGSYLISRVDLLARHPADKIVLLQEAIVIFEKGLTLAKFSGETARLQIQLASCLITMASHATDRHQKREWYRRANTLLGEAATVEAYAKSPRLNSLWGVALAKLGQLSRDTFKVREATQRLQTALESDPADPELNYNLACAYALLRDANTAMRYLRATLDNDPTGQYYKIAEADPDLERIRSSDVYKEVFRSGRPFDDLTRPILSQ